MQSCTTRAAVFRLFTHLDYLYDFYRFVSRFALSATVLNRTVYRIDRMQMAVHHMLNEMQCYMTVLTASLRQISSLAPGSQVLNRFSSSSIAVS